MSVIVFPRGQLTDSDREAMKDAGIVAVEADDPSAVVVVPSAPLVSGDVLLLAALDGLVTNHYDDAPRGAMVKSLHKMLNAKPEIAAAPKLSGEE